MRLYDKKIKAEYIFGGLTYDWNANPDSLYKRYNRGEIKQER